MGILAFGQEPKRLRTFRLRQLNTKRKNDANTKPNRINTNSGLIDM